MLLFTLISTGLLSGCSTMYKSGQTPDDVYYSPGRDGLTAKEEEVQKEEQARYEEYISSQEDRYLRMKVANRSRWNSLDDFNYWNDSRFDFCQSYYGRYNSWNNLYAWNPYYYSMNPAWNYGMGYYSGWRPGMGWGWSSPIYTVIGYSNPKVYSGYTSGSNITAYKNRTYNNANLGYRDAKTGQWVNNGSQNSFGNLVKRVFSSSPNNNQGNTNNSWDRPVRTFDNSSNSSSSTSSSAGGNSGGFKSTGSSSSSGRGRGN